MCVDEYAEVAAVDHAAGRGVPLLVIQVYDDGDPPLLHVALENRRQRMLALASNRVRRC